MNNRSDVRHCPCGWRGCRLWAACSATHRRPPDPNGPAGRERARELRADASIRGATGCRTLRAEGAGSGPRAELDIGADKRTST
jgi:hypothetical protein